VVTFRASVNAKTSVRGMMLRAHGMFGLIMRCDAFEISSNSSAGGSSGPLGRPLPMPAHMRSVQHQHAPRA
jgi:hypothetical protein